LINTYPKITDLPGYNGLTSASRAAVQLVLENLASSKRKSDPSTSADGNNFIVDSEEFNGNASDDSYDPNEPANPVDSDSSDSDVVKRPNNNRKVKQGSMIDQLSSRSADHISVDNDGTKSRSSATGNASRGGKVVKANLREPITLEEQEKLKREMVQKLLLELERGFQNLRKLVESTRHVSF
jgi:hypothetical protein